MTPVTFKYFVIRCVPRIDREEFVNVGVVLLNPVTGFIAAGTRLDEARVRALAAGVDLDAVRAALASIEAVCRGDREAGGEAAGLSPRERFGWLSSPRSTVVQPGPVHGGLAEDPAAELQHLLDTLV